MAPVLVIAAVADELEGLARRLSLPSKPRSGERLRVTGRPGGHVVRLLETGPGLVNTARNLTAAIADQRPAMVIQTGCAGVFEGTGLTVGDIGIASREIDVQLGVETIEDGTVVAPLPFPILEKRSHRIHHTYPLDRRLVQKAAAILNEAFAKTAVKVATGPFLTVVTVTATDKRARKLFNTHDALMENMEGVAAAHVCIDDDIPFLEIRTASNRVGDRDKDTWRPSLAFERAAKAVHAVITANPSLFN